jgi:flavorubredoxin
VCYNILTKITNGNTAHAWQVLLPENGGLYMKISNDVLYIGVNDHNIDLFEGQYVVPNGMAYNSYVIVDEKIAVMDTVDAAFGDEWLDNLASALNGKSPDYLVV